MLTRYLKCVKENKQMLTYNTLGYNTNDLIKYLESFSDYKTLKSGWQLDHKVPIIVCLKLGIKDPKIVNSLYNLQPLSIKENRNKWNKSNKEDIVNLLNHFNLKIDDDLISNILTEVGIYKS